MFDVKVNPILAAYEPTPVAVLKSKHPLPSVEYTGEPYAVALFPVLLRSFHAVPLPI
jgi:hypothetical protein